MVLKLWGSRGSGVDCCEKLRHLYQKYIKDFVYVRNFQDLVRARAYVQGQGAQRLTRRMLSVLCPSTCDLDIRSAVFVVLRQLAVRLHLGEAIPGAAFQRLTKLAVNRAGVCKDDLRLTVKEGKQVLHSVLFGGIVPTALRDNEFTRSFQRLSIILRWTACSLLPDVYERTKAMKSKTHPELLLQKTSSLRLGKICRAAVPAQTRLIAFRRCADTSKRVRGQTR